MARAMWKGAISFGLVVIPVKMYTATAGKGLNLHFLHKKCLTRPRQVRYCEQDNEYFGNDDTVKAYEYTKGQYVVLRDSDFEKVPIKTLHTIAIVGFVNSSEIDPLYFRSGYYLEPEDIAARPFALLREALVKTAKIGVARVTFQKREHLCCLRPLGDGIVLHTMHYQNEIVPLTELTLPRVSDLSKQELDMAESLVGTMTTSFRPQDFKDEYEKALKDLLAARVRGEETKAPKVPAPKVGDLMASLRESVEKAMREAEAKHGARQPETASPRRR